MITVLVATDAEWLHTLVRTALLAEDANIIAVTNGREVRDAVRDNSPDVVIADMQIGSMGGIAVAMDLQLEAADGRLPEVPVVLLLDRAADRVLAERVRSDAILIKPVDASTIRATVLQVVSAPSASPSA